MERVFIDPGTDILPMPLALIGAKVAGRASFMPAAFLGIMNMSPPMLAMGLSPKHHTCLGIEAGRVFSVNLPSVEQAEIADYCGLHSGAKLDKSALFPLCDGPNGAPLIESCPLSVECRLIESKPLGIDTLYLGEIVAMRADPSCLKDGRPDWDVIRPILFTFPDKAYRGIGPAFARAWHCGKAYSGATLK